MNSINYLPRIFQCLVLVLLVNTATAADLSVERPGVSDVVERVAQGVVSVSVEASRQTASNQLQDLRRFFDIPNLPEELPQQPQQGVGSGVIIDAEAGYILTNHHVVSEAEKITVNLQDRRSFTARLVGSDEGTDIALLQIDAEDLTAVPMSDSETVRVGDFVLAIGNPFGLGQTVTSGIVSALGRSGINRDGYEDFIQTDASINPGNSGGALVDYNGQLIGINTAIIAPSGGNVGIGFSVPITMAMRVVDQLIEFGEVSRGRLGVYIEDLTPEVAEAMDVDVQQGAVVTQVEPNTAASRAGLEPMDVITRVNDSIVDSASELRNLVGLSRAGEEVTLTYMRDGREQSQQVTLGGVPDQNELAETSPIPAAGMLQGLELTALPDNHPLAGQVEGVLVSAVLPGSLAEARGIQQGDIITAVNRNPVTSPDELLGLVDEETNALVLSINREGRRVVTILR